MRCRRAPPPTRRGQELEITLALDVFFPTLTLVDLLGQFCAAFSSVTLRLEIEAMGAVAELVIEGEAMLGILGTLPIIPPNVLHVSLPSVLLVAVASPAHALAQISGRIPAYLLKQQVQLVLSDRSALTANQDFSVHSSLAWGMSDLGTKHALLRAAHGLGLHAAPCGCRRFGQRPPGADPDRWPPAAGRGAADAMRVPGRSPCRSGAELVAGCADQVD